MATKWHPEEIKAQLRMRGITLSDVARDLDLPPSMVSAAIRHRARRHRGVEARVARLLGVTPRDLWPDRYAAKKTSVAHAA